MIIVKVQGGLANQMFQYAFGRSLSLKWRQPLFLDLGFYDLQHFRKFELDKFEKLSYQSVNPAITKAKRIHDIFEYKNFWLWPWNNYYFDGYWQTEKYFKNIRNILLNEFALSPSPKNNLSQKYAHVFNKKTISIHVRRTDYLTSKDNYHPVQPVGYYEHALKKIADSQSHNLLVFSDDMDWCKKHFDFPNQHFIEGNDNVEDLFLMSWCTHNIIANSSFSWWAAWLNANPHKVVVAPAKWFGDTADVSPADIIPKEWTLIN